MVIFGNFGYETLSELCPSCLPEKAASPLYRALAASLVAEAGFERATSRL